MISIKQGLAVISEPRVFSSVYDKRKLEHSLWYDAVKPTVVSVWMCGFRVHQIGHWASNMACLMIYCLSLQFCVLYDSKDPQIVVPLDKA